MKKIIISMMLALAGMGLTLAQQTFKIQVEGRDIVEGEIITLDSLKLQLIIANTSSDQLYIQPVFDVTQVPTDLFPQFCAKQCFLSIEQIPVLDIKPNGFLGKDEDVHLAVENYGGITFDTAIIGCTFTDTTTKESLQFTVKFTEKKSASVIASNELEGVSVYPNPADGLFNLNVPARAQVEIFSANGQVVRQMEVGAGQTSLQLNNAGIYFIRVRANGKQAVKRLVVR